MGINVGSISKKPKIAILTIRNSYKYGGIFTCLKQVYKFCEKYFDPTVFYLSFDKNISANLKSFKFASGIKNADFADIDVVPSARNIEGVGININGKKFEGGSIFELLNGVGTENLPDDEIKNILKNKDFKVVIIDERTGEVVAEKFVDGTTLYEGGDIIW